MADYEFKKTNVKPGACIPWEEEKKRLPPLQGDEALVKTIYEDIDAFGYTYIWHCLLSF